MMYASGCYSNYSLWESYKHAANPNEVKAIINYEVYPEVGEQYRSTIQELVDASVIYKEYQASLQEEATRCEQYERAGKQYPFEEHKRQLDSLLAERLYYYPTVTISKLKKFI